MVRVFSHMTYTLLSVRAGSVNEFNAKLNALSEAGWTIALNAQIAISPMGDLMLLLERQVFK